MEFIIYILLFLIFILTIDICLKIRRSKILTLRINKYTILDEDDNISIVDALRGFYKMVIKETSNILLRFKFFKKYSLKYTKYLTNVDNKDLTQMDFVTKKIYLGILFSFTYFILSFIKPYKLNIYLAIILLILGFYIYDIILIYRFYKRKQSIEKELVNAIMLMNNSFKSGKSLIQAIKIVSEELNGPISDEFKKIYTELSYGLSIELSFKRFYNRTKVEDIKFIASSLSILSETGGNIIKVFDELEKTLINKKEYEKEKDALTSSSKILVKFLLIIPIVIVFIIYIIDNSYFKVLYTTKIGLFVLAFILLDYIIYIICVKKVLRVRV